MKEGEGFYGKGEGDQEEGVKREAKNKVWSNILPQFSLALASWYPSTLLCPVR